MALYKSLITINILPLALAVITTAKIEEKCTMRSDVPFTLDSCSTQIILDPRMGYRIQVSPDTAECKCRLSLPRDDTALGFWSAPSCVNLASQNDHCAVNIDHNVITVNDTNCVLNLGYEKCGSLYNIDFCFEGTSNKASEIVLECCNYTQDNSITTHTYGLTGIDEDDSTTTMPFCPGYYDDLFRTFPIGGWIGAGIGLLLLALGLGILIGYHIRKCSRSKARSAESWPVVNTQTDTSTSKEFPQSYKTKGNIYSEVQILKPAKSTNRKESAYELEKIPLDKK